MKLSNKEKVLRTSRPCRYIKKRKIANNSDLRFHKPKLEYYKNHGEYILVPKTKRLNWDDVTKIDSVLNSSKGKKISFGMESGKMINSIDHIGETMGQESIPKIEHYDPLSNLKVTRKSMLSLRFFEFYI